MDAGKTALVRQIRSAATVHSEHNIEEQLWAKADLRGQSPSGSPQSEEPLGRRTYSGADVRQCESSDPR